MVNYRKFFIVPEIGQPSLPPPWPPRRQPPLPLPLPPRFAAAAAALINGRLLVWPRFFAAAPSPGCLNNED